MLAAQVTCDVVRAIAARVLEVDQMAVRVVAGEVLRKFVV